MARARWRRSWCCSAQLGCGATAALAVLLPPIEFKPPVLWALLVGGALLGALAGRAVGVRRDPGGVLVQGGAWHLLPASLALVGLQVAALAGSIDGVVVATAAIVACAAFAAAAGALVVTRGSVAGLRAAAPVAGGAAPGVPIPRPGPPPATPAATPSAVAPGRVPVRASCGSCGAAVHMGWNHCVTCGAALAWT